MKKTIILASLIAPMLSAYEMGLNLSASMPYASDFTGMQAPADYLSVEGHALMDCLLSDRLSIQLKGGGLFT